MTKQVRRMILPFTAIIGQEKMKKALILNAINPRIGGVLIRGEKGTAKSTAVRALSEILPEIEVVKDCPFNCDPNDQNGKCDICSEKLESGIKPETVFRRMRVLNLPLGATEDRVLGTIDIEKAIKEGIKALEPGILAEANRGILYIDEVNLLDDHVADVLLDSAAMGVNVIEREGISVSHPSNFILVGTMNPEEGELRPQLLDRFGLQVGVESIFDAKKRVQIVKTAEEFEGDPEGFLSKCKENQKELSKKILSAKSILKDVVISDDLLEAIANTCIDLGVRSHRAEIVITRTAKTIAALDGRKKVKIEDVKEAMDFALPHRMRRTPFEQPELNRDDLDNSLSNSKKNKKDQDKRNSEEEKLDTNSEVNEVPKESVFDIGKPIDTKNIHKGQKDKIYRKRVRGRSFSSKGSKGKYIRSEIPKEKPKDIALDATIRASAPYQNKRKNNGDDCTIVIKRQDIREKVKIGKVLNACVFVVDASGSMGAKKRMNCAKGAVLSLLMQSYQKRDKVGMVSFRGEKADILLPLCSSVDLAVNKLSELPTGGRTPLSSGLKKGIGLLLNEIKKDREIKPMLVLISDGHANVGLGSRVIKDEIIGFSKQIKEYGIHTVVIDTETKIKSFVDQNIGYCSDIAFNSGGRYYSIEDLTAEKIHDITFNERELSMNL